MTTTKPERWAIDAGSAAMARLDIPADAIRERGFEISFSMTVRPAAAAKAPRHELRIYVDGELVPAPNTKWASPLRA